MNICDLLARAAVAACFLIAELAVPVSARAQPFAGNPSSGRQVATTICSSCHQVIGGKGRDGPPSFVDIASMPSTTALSLKVFLRSNHKEMNLASKPCSRLSKVVMIAVLIVPSPSHLKRGH
jgi:mono/diheme cytochrome c family protein